MEERKARQRHESTGHNDAGLVAQHLEHRLGFKLMLLQHGLEFGRHDHAQAGKQRQNIERQGHEEREAPAPGQEFRVGQLRGEDDEEGAGQTKAHGGTQLRHHRVPAALSFRRIHGQKRNETIPCTAKANALSNAEHGEQDRREHASVVIGRQEADRHGRSTEREQRCGQFDGASELAVDLQKQERANRTGDEGERKYCEGIERCRERIDKREEDVREDQRRGDGINEEVEKFRHSGQDDRDRNAIGIDCDRRRRLAVRSFMVFISGRIRVAHKIPSCIWASHVCNAHGSSSVHITCGGLSHRGSRPSNEDCL